MVPSLLLPIESSKIPVWLSISRIATSLIISPSLSAQPLLTTRTPKILRSSITSSRFRFTPTPILYDASGDRVALMTLHCPKDSKFENVFIVGLEDGILPHERTAEEE